MSRHVTYPNAAFSPGRWRLLAAFAILPPVQALVAFLVFPAVLRLAGHDSAQLHDAAQTARAFALLTALLGLLVTIAGAIPMVVWLMKRGRVSLGQLLLVGLLLGNAPFAVYVIALILPATVRHFVNGTLSAHLLPVSELMAGTFRVIVIGSAFGTLSAAVFWLTAIYRTDASRSRPPFSRPDSHGR